MKTYGLLTPILLVLLLGLATLVGCDSSETSATAESRLQLLLQDAPFDDVVEAWVTIERIELIGEDDRLVLLADEPQRFDLVTLQDGVTATLVDLDVPDDTYHQVRLVVAEEATLTFDDGTTEPLKVPSGTQTGIKLNLPPLVLDDDLVVVTVDFDLDASFVERGNSGQGYLFKPVLKPVALQVNGESVDLDDDL